MKLNRFILLAVACAAGTGVHAQYQVIHSFTSAPDTPAGAVAPAIIAQGESGNLLMTARARGATSADEAVAFRVTPSGALTVIHKFAGTYVDGGLTLGRDSLLYGTTNSGGTSGNGTIFKMTWDGKVTTLRELNGGDEAVPLAPPIQSLHGEFYGTAAGQGNDPGIVYKIDSWGTYSVVHTFIGADGQDPAAPLVQGTDYWFYGVTQVGGANNVGAIFRVNSTGQFERLFSFDRAAHGMQPVALIQGNDGNFYGMTYAGGSCNEGVAFKMTPAHAVTVLHNFCSQADDGGGPLGGLIQGSDGFLYGITGSGGTRMSGVLFRLSTSGQFTVLHSFDRPTGIAPVSLIQHTNGSLYGMTAGGPNGGVVFRYNLGVAPFIRYMDTYGRVGESVKILGEGFTNATQVSFNGVRAQVSYVTPTYLSVVVPNGATTGPITATTTYGTLKSDKAFIVRP